MAGVPKLVDLCMIAIADELVRGDDDNDMLSVIPDIPSELFDNLLPHLPPLALQKLQENLPFNFWDNFEHAYDDNGDCRKRRRCRILDAAWQALYEVRWPSFGHHKRVVDWPKHDEAKNKFIDDWQQIYWEVHLQNCVDIVTETALLPSYGGSIGEIRIPDVILKQIGLKTHLKQWTCDYAKFSNHCQQFGLYARNLRLQNAMCVAETCNLLQNTKLVSLELRWIKSSDHVEGLCKLLKQNCKTLKSVEFINCKLPSSFVSAICDSLIIEDLQAHEVEHFSIKGSSFLQTDLSPMPVGLTSFLTSGRSLQSLMLPDDHLGRNFARVIFSTLLDVSAPISVLDLSENNISGFLSQFRWRSSSCLGKTSTSLESLRVLNLRSCNFVQDDAACIKQALVHMPNLQNLDLSDNSIENGLMSLVSYFSDISSRDLPFNELKLENCELTNVGVIELFQVLSTMKKPLKLLSIKDNRLGRLVIILMISNASWRFFWDQLYLFSPAHRCSTIGAPLGRFLCTGIHALDVEDIGLCSFGFHQAIAEITKELEISYINISNNQGGIETANFVLSLILHAHQINSIDARYNLMPQGSLSVIFSGFKTSKGKLRHMDLSGNSFCYRYAADVTSILNEFQIDREFDLVLSALPYAPYDDEP